MVILIGVIIMVVGFSIYTARRAPTKKEAMKGVLKFCISGLLIFAFVFIVINHNIAKVDTPLKTIEVYSIKTTSETFTIGETMDRNDFGGYSWYYWFYIEENGRKVKFKFDEFQTKLIKRTDYEPTANVTLYTAKLKNPNWVTGFGDFVLDQSIVKITLVVPYNTNIIRTN